MRMLLVAYPGAGKGTQADRLAAHYDIAHLSSGQLLRDEVERGTPTGQAVAGYVRRGDLVPDELIFEMLSVRLLEAAARGGYVLDGFPRTLPQAEMAYAAVRDLEDVELQAVVYLRVGQAELRERLEARARLEGRIDDDAATVAHRFEVFEAQTKPLLDFYAGRGLLVDIDGDQPVEEVFGAIIGALDQLRV